MVWMSLHKYAPVRALFRPGGDIARYRRIGSEGELRQQQADHKSGHNCRDGMIVDDLPKRMIRRNFKLVIVARVGHGPFFPGETSSNTPHASLFRANGFISRRIERCDARQADKPEHPCAPRVTAGENNMEKFLCALSY